MSPDKYQVGTRLKEFLYKNFPTMEEAAEALGTTVGSLRNSYFNGKSLPGAEILLRLIELGCDLQYLMYGKKSPKSSNPYIPPEYRRVAMIPAGRGEIQDREEWYDSNYLDYSPDDHVFLEVDPEFGFSMMPLINPGDEVLISFKAKIKSGDLVAVRWDKTKGAIKILGNNEHAPDFVVLTSYNQTTDPIVVPKKKTNMYKVVLIKKK